MKRYALASHSSDTSGPGFQIHPNNGVSVGRDDHALKINFLKPSLQAYRFSQLLLRILDHSETGVPNSNNVLEIYCKIYMHKFFPLCADVLKKNRYQIINQDQIKNAFLTLKHLQNAECHIKIDAHTARPTVIVSCRTCNQNEFNLAYRDMGNIFSNANACRSLSRCMRLNEIRLLLSADCTGLDITHHINQYVTKQRQRLKTSSNTFGRHPFSTVQQCYRSKKLKHKPGKNKSRKNKTHIDNGVSVDNKDDSVAARSLCGRSLKYIEEHQAFSNAKSKINNLMESVLLPPGECRGSGLVIIGRHERHRNKKVPGDIKIKINHNNISWRICLENNNSVKLDHDVYSIICVYQKNRSKMEKPLLHRPAYYCF